MGSGNDVVIWELGMVLCLYWECCYYFGIVDAVVCGWGMLLLFVYWECCFYFYIGSNAIICLLVMLLFVFWECCFCVLVMLFCVFGNVVVICIFGMMLLFG
jgi:hypothetical protein